MYFKEIKGLIIIIIIIIIIDEIALHVTYI